MTPEVFAEWMRRQGRRVFKTASTHWHSSGLGAYQAFPYHWLIEPSAEELKDFIRATRALALRYSAPAETGAGRPSYHAVYDAPHYDFDCLSAWARKNVRRGLRHCAVEPISFERLAREGWELQADTLDRQGRRTALSDESWRTKCHAAGDLPGFEAWGAVVSRRLAASVITFRIEECCYLLDQACGREYLSDHVNNALSFVVTQTMVNRPRVAAILYALQSLDAPPRVDEFKFRMGYRAKPVRQCVTLHSYLAPLANRASHALLKMLASWRQDSSNLSKAEGMLRLYLEGRSRRQAYDGLRRRSVVS